MSQRIVSLLASATEIVCALGARDELVGVSHCCDWPDGIDALPACTSAKFELEGTSAEIDSRVKTLVADSAAVYAVDAELLRELDPDVIVTQAKCEVCAVSEDDVIAAVAGWTHKQPKIVTLLPDALADVWDDIKRVGEAIGRGPQAEAFVSYANSRMAVIAKRAGGLVEHGTMPKVAYVEWIDPPMFGGNWIPELIEKAGGDCLFGENGKPSGYMTLDEVAAADPDVVIVAPCGYDLEVTAQHMAAIADKPEWLGLRAVREGRAVIVDGDHFFNRPGPRLVESMEILAEVIWPGDFNFGLEGEAWRVWGRKP